MPKVSILVPCFNTARFLDVCLESACHQTFRDIEILVADDGSTDGSRAIAERHSQKDSRVRLFDGPKSGISANRNFLLGKSTGEYIAWLDSDDVAYPDRISQQVKYFNEHSDVVCLGTAVRVIDEDGSPIRFEVRATDHDTISNELICATSNGIFFPSCMMRSELFQTLKLQSDFGDAEDTDLLLRVSEIGRIANLPDVLLDYRWRMKSTSWTDHFDKARRVWLAINSARRRRALPEKDLSKFEQWSGVDTRFTEAEVQRLWARAAWTAGEFATARKYTLKALKGAPFHPDSWYLAENLAYPLATLPKGIWERVWFSLARRTCKLTRKLLATFRRKSPKEIAYEQLPKI